MLRKWIGLLFMAFALAGPGFAQGSDEDIQKEIEALKKGQDDIRKQLDEIKKLLQQAQPQRPQLPDVKGKEFTLGTNPIKGDDSASLTLVEMTDYQCPYCARYYTQAYPQIQSTYVETGKVRYLVMDLPLESIHKLAFKAAEATRCAGDQDQFWQMHDRLFQNQRAMEPWSGHAEELGLDVAAFNVCLESGKYTDAIREDMAEAAKAGARGTPSFLLAKTNPDDPTKVTGISVLRGAQPFATFRTQIEAALKAEE
jgi:protein-disulfide isomerase